MSKFKSFIKKNGKKIAIGVGLVALAGTAGYFGYNFNNISIENSNNNLTINTLSLNMNNLIHDRNVLMNAASEGLFEEAVATVTRKLNQVKDKIKYCSEWLVDHPNDTSTSKALNEYIEKCEILTIRKNEFLEAKNVFEITLDDLQLK